VLIAPSEAVAEHAHSDPYSDSHAS
jgi:hypothetical protein